LGLARGWGGANRSKGDHRGMGGEKLSKKIEPEKEYSVNRPKRKGEGRITGG